MLVVILLLVVYRRLQKGTRGSFYLEYIPGIEPDPSGYEPDMQTFTPKYFKYENNLRLHATHGCKRFIKF